MERTAQERRLRRGLLSAALLCASCFGVAGAQNINSLAVFGDNIADPGNIPAYLEAGNAAGLGPFDTNFPPSPPYSGNRFSNGPVAAEYLAGLLGAGSVSNLAVGNAFSDQLPVILAGGILIGNGSSIPAPIGRELTPLNETDVANQVGQYLAANPNLTVDDLMLIYASANDGALALNTVALLGLEGEAAATLILDGALTNATNTARSAQRLIDAGAGQVVLALLPDIGRTPAAAAGGLSGVAAGTLFSVATNQALTAEAARLNATTGAVVTVFDSFTLLADIVANPAKYGLSNVTDPCLLTPACIGDPAAVDQYLFFDPFFPTTAVHEITAAALADTVNAPKTLAGQAEVGRFAAMQFGERLLSQASFDEGAAIHAAIDRLDWERDGASFAFGYDAQIDRLALGAQRGLGDAWRIGASIAIDDGDVRFDGLSAGFDFDSLRLGVTFGREFGAFGLDALLAYSDDDYDNIERFTAVANQTTRGSTEGDTLMAMLQLKTSFERERWSWSPFLRVGRTEADVDGYVEAGATALDQSIDSRESESTFAEIGVRLAGAWSGGSTGWRPSAALTYHAELSDDDQQVGSRLVTVPEVTRMLSLATPDDDYLRLNLALDWQVSDALLLGFVADVTDGADELEGWSAGLRLDYRY